MKACIYLLIYTALLFATLAGSNFIFTNIRAMFG